MGTFVGTCVGYPDGVREGLTVGAEDSWNLQMVSSPSKNSPNVLMFALPLYVANSDENRFEPSLLSVTLMASLSTISRSDTQGCAGIDIT